MKETSDSGAVPQACAVAGYHAKSIITGAQIVVGNLAIRSDGMAPALVNTFELVLVANAIGNGKTQRREGKCKSCDELRRAGRGPARLTGLPSEVTSSMWIIAGAEVEMTREGSATEIPRFIENQILPCGSAQNRLLALDAFRAVQTIVEAVLADIGLRRRRCGADLSRFTRKNVIGSGDPKPSEMVFGNSKDLFVQGWRARRSAPGFDRKFDRRGRLRCRSRAGPRRP